MQSKTFDTSTIQGLKAAERFKAKLENQYDKVIVTAIGFNRVRIEGRARQFTAFEIQEGI
jgi:hypothetical protein